MTFFYKKIFNFYKNLISFLLTHFIYFLFILLNPVSTKWIREIGQIFRRPCLLDPSSWCSGWFTIWSQWGRTCKAKSGDIFYITSYCKCNLFTTLDSNNNLYDVFKTSFYLNKKKQIFNRNWKLCGCSLWLFCGNLQPKALNIFSFIVY